MNDLLVVLVLGASIVWLINTALDVAIYFSKKKCDDKKDELIKSQREMIEAQEKSILLNKSIAAFWEKRCKVLEGRISEYESGIDKIHKILENKKEGEEE